MHMGLGPLVLSATTSLYATYAACLLHYVFNLGSIFDLHLYETMTLAQGKQFRQQSTAWL